MVSREIDKHARNVQAREHMTRNLVWYVEEISAKRKNHWREEKPKLDKAPNLRRMYGTDLEDMEVKETFKI